MCTRYAYIALGSNLDDRYGSIVSSLNKIKMIGKVLRTSYLYETMPMYHTEQSRFLNAVCLIETNLLPMELLVELQSIEQNVGRTQTFRNGPRLIDLDIVLMTNSDGTCDDIVQITNETLTVPHFRMTERSFVLMPLCDIDENLIHPVLKLSMRDLLAALPDESFADMTRVIPCRNHLTRVTQFIRIPIKKVAENNVDVKPNQGFMPLIVGVLNVTPDSFSDGGQYDSVDSAANRALEMVRQGATVVDIGGESTRPGAEDVDAQVEADRVVSVIRRIRELGSCCLISVDTRKAGVARAAVEAGADIINDVSAGRHDPEMLPLIEALGIPFIAMHMRGDPSTMLELGRYSSVVDEVAMELMEQLERLDTMIPRWLQIVDPGIGFAKGLDENMTLLRPHNLRRLGSLLKYRPLLVGVSRKRFLTTVLEKEKKDILSNNAPCYYSSTEDMSSLGTNINDRDLATSGACCAAILGGAHFLRVHNVKDVVSVCSVFSAVMFQ